MTRRFFSITAVIAVIAVGVLAPFGATAAAEVTQQQAQTMITSEYYDAPFTPSQYRRKVGSNTVLVNGAVRVSAVENPMTKPLQISATKGNEHIIFILTVAQNYATSVQTNTLVIQHVITGGGGYSVVDVVDIKSAIDYQLDVYISAEAGAWDVGEDYLYIMLWVRNARYTYQVALDGDMMTDTADTQYRVSVINPSTSVPYEPHELYNMTDYKLSIDFVPQYIWAPALDYSGIDAVLTAEAGTVSWTWLSSVITVVDTFLNIEWAPGIKLWYILAIPIAFGVVMLFIAIIKR